MRRLITALRPLRVAGGFGLSSFGFSNVAQIRYLGILRAPAMVKLQDTLRGMIGPTFSFSTSTPSYDEINGKVIGIVKKYTKDSVQITDKSHIVNDLGLDSLDQVDIVMAIEDEFGIEFSDNDASSIATVENAIDQVKKYIDGKA